MRKQSLVNKNLSFSSTRHLLVLAITFASIFLSACSSGHNFSQFPGFNEYFSNHPPSEKLPDAAEIALLDLYKPRIFLAKEQMGPIDFYRDYIAQGSLKVDGERIDQVTADVLNQYRTDPDALFEYEGNYQDNNKTANTGMSVVYARIDYENTVHRGNRYEFTFLTYNLVFPVSGLLKGLGTLSSLGLGLVGNLNDWHQLDHYIAVSVALENSTPVAMTLQHHNYQSTHLLNPASPDISVDVAMRSNELYRHSDTRMEHPAVSFANDSNLEFLLTGTNKPIMAGFDITFGEAELTYELRYLPQSDAFYQFQGSLGKRRLLPGRSGPPGADYTTLPGLLPRHLRMMAAYRTNNVEQEINLFTALFDRENFVIREDALDAYKDRFLALLAEQHNR